MSGAALHLVMGADVAAQPWRNGGGSTQELLAWPTAHDWQCRISVARIDRNGPFSAFPGIERWFTVLRGEGVVLRLGKRRTMLTAGSEPLRFEGAAAPGCELLDGPTEDLNLMLKSDAGHGAMRQAQPGEHWLCDAPLRAVFCLDSTALQIDHHAATPLPAGTLAWSDAAAHLTWHLQKATVPARAWWLHFKPRRP